MSIAAGIVSILNWLKDKLPIANRLEKIKNDIDKLKREKKEILAKPWSQKNADRIIAIDNQLDVLNVRMQNACGN